MFTRVQPIISGSSDAIYDAILNACHDAKVKIKHAIKSGYQIDGKSSITLTRFGQKIKTVLKDLQEGTLVQSYEFPGEYIKKN
jgi:hypothetical protein